MLAIDRRVFVKTAAAASLAGLGLGPAPSAGCGAEGRAGKRKFTMGLGCGHIGVAADQRQAMRFAHQYGFEAVEPAPGFLSKLSDAELQDLLADLKAKKLVWAAAGLPLDFRGDETPFQEGLQRLGEFARGLERAGVTRVATWLSPSHRSLTYVANFRQHARRLREAAKVLGDHGQRLGLEYVGPKTSWTAGRFPFIHTMAEMKDLIAEIGRDNVGFLLDSWHWYTAGETEADLVSLQGRDVVACHLNDAPQGIPVDQQVDNRRELPCATGVIDLKTFLGALVTIGYDGPIVAEPFNQELRALAPEEAVAATAAAMKKAFALVEGL
jgi:sugar phosphate isomerase/epimerase